MAAETESGGPSVATVREALDAAAETIAAAGCEEPRADAEALVADALGIEPGASSSRDGAGEVPPELAAAIEERVRAPRRARAARLHPRPRTVPRDRGRGRLARADPAPRDRPAGRGRRRAARGGARARGRHRLGGGRPRPAQRAPRPARHRLRPLPGGRRSRARERRAARPLPGGDGRRGAARRSLGDDVDLVLANLPYVTDETIFERSPEIRREPRIAVTGRLRRGRPRRDPRADRRRRRAAGGWRSSTTPTTARRCGRCCATRLRCGTTWVASG